MSKNYQKLWNDRLRELAGFDLAGNFKLSRKHRGREFDLVVDFVQSGLDADDQKLLKTFRNAKLNIGDPFHWWQLLHELLMVHENRPAGARKAWKREKVRKLERDCVRVGRRQPATNSIKEICKRLKQDLNYSQTPENLQTLVTRLRLTAEIKRKIVLVKK